MCVARRGAAWVVVGRRDHEELSKTDAMCYKAMQAPFRSQVCGDNHGVIWAQGLVAQWGGQHRSHRAPCALLGLHPPWPAVKYHNTLLRPIPWPLRPHHSCVAVAAEEVIFGAASQREHVPAWGGGTVGQGR